MCLLAGILACGAAQANSPAPAGQPDPVPDSIQLEVHPRVCTLAAGDPQCDTLVEARWHSPRDESLCLVIVGHPDIKHCWENFTKGQYSVRLTFGQDLTLQLRDPQLRNVLVSKAITVIKEAMQLRRKRRQPWSIFN